RRRRPPRRRRSRPPSSPGPAPTGPGRAGRPRRPSAPSTPPATARAARGGTGRRRTTRASALLVPAPQGAAPASRTGWGEPRRTPEGAGGEATGPVTGPTPSRPHGGG